MKRSQFIRAVLFTCAATLWPALAAVARDDGRKLDLADVAQGHYFGEVISDSKGSSKSGVTLTVTKAGKNRVRITSDYARLPVVEVTMEKVMDKIMNAGGSTVFLLDRSKSPPRLDVSFLNEVSWSGERQ